AQIAAQMTAKAGSGLGAFDFALEPQGLGRVDVSLKIDSQGQLSAVLSFDNAGVAAEAKARSGDLQQALQQAGFNLSQSGLTFTSGGGQGGGSAWQGAPSRSFTTAAGSPIAAVDASSSPSTPTAWRGASGARGLDIVI
ncbi:MAG: flagellar hook-length control protein FliK, partial [Caulobacteraceae bacterium]